MISVPIVILDPQVAMRYALIDEQLEREQQLDPVQQVENVEQSRDLSPQRKNHDGKRYGTN